MATEKDAVFYVLDVYDSEIRKEAENLKECKSYIESAIIDDYEDAARFIIVKEYLRPVLKPAVVTFEKIT